MPRSDGRTRLFVREVCRNKDECSKDMARIGSVDFGLNQTQKPTQTQYAWRPQNSVSFDPLGLSLVADAGADHPSLYVIDATKPPQIWKVEIDQSFNLGREALYVGPTPEIQNANDLQAAPEGIYVTRFDPFGFLPWRNTSWNGIVLVSPTMTPKPFARGLTGANGIVRIGSEPSRFVVSSYWERRLRIFAGETSKEEMIFATDELDIHPDNLTLDGSTLYIAGQKNALLAALNLMWSAVTSPSAVYAIDVQQLGPGAKPRLVWQSGGADIDSNSVSVAVPVPGAIALGHIRNADILLIDCQLQRPQ